MKIPDTIEIIGHDVGITQQEKIEVDGKEICGLACFDYDQIILADTIHGEKISEVNKAEAFLHETVHHVGAAFELNLSERQVLCLARGLLAVIRNNNLNFLDRD